MGLDAESREQLLDLATGLEEFAGRLGLDPAETREAQTLAKQVKAQLATGGGEDAEDQARQLRALLAGIDNRLARGAVEQLDRILG
jgi:hypothetical protein